MLKGTAGRGKDSAWRLSGGIARWLARAKAKIRFLSNDMYAEVPLRFYEGLIAARDHSGSFRDPWRLSLKNP